MFSLINVLGGAGSVSMSPLMSPTTFDSPSNSSSINQVSQLQRHLLRYRELLENLQLADLDIDMYSKQALTRVYLTLRLLFYFVKFLIELPMFLPGVLFHMPVYFLARIIEGMEKYEECKAQNKIAAMVAVLPLLYGLLFRWLWSLLGYTITGLCSALVLTMTFSIYHMAVVDDRYELIYHLDTCWRMWGFVVMGRGKADGKGRSKVEECVELRRECVVGLSRVLKQGKLEGNESAIYLSGFTTKTNN